LHQFIQKMNKREKAYFTSYASTAMHGKQSNYFRLYTYLSNHTSFDKKEIEHYFSEETFVQHLTSELSYLQGILFRTLISYNFERTPKDKLGKTILIINILLERGFKVEAQRKIKRAKETAYKLEDFTSILKLIEYEEEAYFQIGILGYMKKLDELAQERQRIYDTIKNLNQLRILREEIRNYALNMSGPVNMQVVSKYFDNELMKDEKSVLSIKAKEHWYYVLSMRLFITKGFDYPLDSSLAHIRLIEDNPQVFKNATMLPVLSNALYHSAYQKEVEIFEQFNTKLLQFKNKSETRNNYIAYVMYARRIELYFQLKDVQKNEQIINDPKFNKLLTHGKLVKAQVDYLYFLIVRACIMNNDFRKARSYVNEGIVKIQDSKFMLHLRIFSLLIYLELEQFSILSYEMKSTIKVLKMHKMYNELAKAFIEFIRKYTNNKNDSALLTELIQHINTYKSNVNKISSTDVDGLLYWCAQRKLRKDALNNS
ncbi:MAG: hypothetical protein AAF617_11430, partial [Bacteroidota bacterium]